ncbi:MAG: DUF599 domain-containing protein [Gammaproteobacteria bacterium]|nr:DUF599 domain-containing protein [Gammaproteobacteria bacterium]
MASLISYYWNYIIDGAIFLFCAFVLGGYQWRLIRRSHRSPTRTVQGMNMLARTSWVEQAMDKGWDVVSVQTLRNATMAATLMASTAVILILGILNMLANADKIGPTLHILNLTGTHDSSIWIFKLMLILVDFFIAFFAFSLAVRGYNHVGFLINVPADKTGKSHGVTPVTVAVHLNRAAAYYGIGMRTYYFSVPLLLWVFGSIWMVISTFGVLLVLKHLDHLPQQD